MSIVQEQLFSQLSPRSIHYFNEAIAAGSIRSASDRLDIEPSVISRQIRQLEQCLGMSLMERHGRGVRPTEAGELLSDFHRERQASEQSLLGKLAALDGLERGQIRLSISEGYNDILAGGVLGSFSTRHPALQITLMLASVNGVVRQVFEGQAHLGVAYSPRLMPGIHAVASVRQPVHLLVRPGHPLTRKGRPLSVKEILNWPLALIDHGFGLRQLIDTVEVIEKCNFQATLISNSLATLKHYVTNSDGVTFMAEVAAHKEIRQKQLVALPIDHPVFMNAETHVLARSGRPLSPGALELLHHILHTPPFCEGRIDTSGLPESKGQPAGHI
ncbi:LysR family transcriptional regulator [Kushneria sp. EE4]